MMEKRNGTGSMERPASRRLRWRSGGWGIRFANFAGRRRIWLLTIVVVALFGALGARALRSLSAPPKVEPGFENISGERPGPVKEFALRDVHGVLHTRDEWRGRPAIVLFFITEPGRTGNGLAAAERLVRKFSPRGCLFACIIADKAEKYASAAESMVDPHLSFPVLLDPRGEVTRQAGIRASTGVIVLSADGQVFYHGQIGNQDGAGRLGRSRVRANGLESALEAILAGEMPIDALTEPVGGPLLDLNVSADLHPSEEITFARHVAPILYTNCVRCHRPGQVGPFSLVTYKDALKRANVLYEAASDGRMPPWKPHPGVGLFLDAARLSATEVETLRMWAQTGCKQGDAADLPTPPKFTDGWELGEPDLVLEMPESFSVPAAGPDIYRSFCLPFPLDQDVTIHGVEFRPGNRRITHHSRIYLDETGDAKSRDRDDSEPGFAGWFGSVSRLELPYPGIGAWTPGMTPRFAPEGVGRVIRHGSDVVVQIHYHPIGKPATDKSSVGLFFTRKPTTKTMAGYALCTDQIDIPPGEKRHKIILSTRLKADIHLYTVVPHAHYLCREFRLAATLPDGTTLPLLWITDWDMDWQDQYRFSLPVPLPEGTVLTLAAYFDNSEDNPRNPNKPPRRVRYGVETTAEMCACHLEFLVDDPRARAFYTQKSPFGL
jgi:AhpC/TSA family